MFEVDIDRLSQPVLENPMDWQARLVLADALEEGGNHVTASDHRAVAQMIRNDQTVLLRKDQWVTRNFLWSVGYLYMNYTVTSRSVAIRVATEVTLENRAPPADRPSRFFLGDYCGRVLQDYTLDNGEYDIVEVPLRSVIIETGQVINKRQTLVIHAHPANAHVFLRHLAH